MEAEGGGQNSAGRKPIKSAGVAGRDSGLRVWMVPFSRKGF